MACVVTVPARNTAAVLDGYPNDGIRVCPCAWVIRQHDFGDGREAHFVQDLSILFIRVEFSCI